MIQLNEKYKSFTSKKLHLQICFYLFSKQWKVPHLCVDMMRQHLSRLSYCTSRVSQSNRLLMHHQLRAGVGRTQSQKNSAHRQLPALLLRNHFQSTIQVHLQMQFTCMYMIRPSNALQYQRECLSQVACSNLHLLIYLLHFWALEFFQVQCELFQMKENCLIRYFSKSFNLKKRSMYL